MLQSLKYNFLLQLSAKKKMLSTAAKPRSDEGGKSDSCDMLSYR